MAIQGLRGYGVTTVNQNSPLTAQDLAYFPRLTGFTLSLEIETFDASAFSKDATIEIVDTVTKSNTWSLSVEMESFDKNDFELLLNEFTQASTNWVFPTCKADTVPTTAPYEIVDADLAGTTITDVHVTLLSSGAGDEKAFQMVAAPTSPSVTEAQLDEPNTKLVFDSSFAGRSIAYIIYQPYNLDTIFVEDNPTKLNTLSFFGILAGPRLQSGLAVYIPRMSRLTGFELAVADETTASIEYRPTVSGANRTPVQFGFLT